MLIFALPDLCGVNINYCSFCFLMSYSLLIFVVFSVKTTIELVGSCCTLVTEILLEAAFSIPDQACEMLYSTYHVLLEIFQHCM